MLSAFSGSRGLEQGPGRSMDVMVNQNELEEGEAHARPSFLGDTNIDPDVAFSYIDHRLKAVLGHFQKEFEGGVSADKLGAKYGGYGSFLPTEERFASALLQPRAQATSLNSNAARPSHELTKEQIQPVPQVLRQKDKTTCNLSNVNTKLNTASAHKTEVHKVPATGRREKFPPKKDSVSKTTGMGDQTKLRFKLKQSPESLKRVRNSAIYCELGLQNSPTSSSESSPIDGHSCLLEDDSVSKQYPMTTIKMMTEYKIPGGSLLSPIQESLLNFPEVFEHTKGLEKLGKRRKTDNSEASFSGKGEVDLVKESRHQNQKVMSSNEDQRKYPRVDKHPETDSVRVSTYNSKIPPMPYSKDSSQGPVGSGRPTIGTEQTGVPRAPVVIEECWVQCDSCNKWRLLPFGRQAPCSKKWHCSMLDWLLQMNSCEFSEEATTNALYASYGLQPPNQSQEVHWDKDCTQSSGHLTLNAAADNKMSWSNGVPNNGVKNDEGEFAVTNRQKASFLKSKSLNDVVQRHSVKLQGTKANGHIAEVCNKQKKREKMKLVPDTSEEGCNITQENASAKRSNEDKLDSQKPVKKIKSDSLAYDGKNTHDTKSLQNMHVDRCDGYMHVRKDVDVMSTSSFSNAGNTVLREATSLKHVGDRLRNGEGSTMESTLLYFEAALKYLLAASIFEAGKSDTMKTGELSYAMKIYTDTAQLFKYCASQFEQLRKTAAAALAYKCMAVAYMRVVCSKTTLFTRDPVDIESLLHSALIGNLSNAHICARLQYANDVMAGMDAFSKSEKAFAVAVKEAQVSERSGQIPAVKMVIDFSFQDIDSFLQLARRAMETLHH